MFADVIIPDVSPGISNSSVVGPTMVGKLASAFVDTMYKA